MASPCHEPSSLPTPCTSQLGSRACQELRHTAPSDKWPHCTQSYSSYFQLSQPSTLQARPKPVVAFMPTFGKYSRVQCHHPHPPKRMHHWKVSCVYLFLPMPDAGVRPGASYCSKVDLNIQLKESGEVSSGEQSQVPALIHPTCR